MSEAYVKSHSDHLGVTTIEFFHPQGNSLPGASLNSLAQEIHHAALNEDTRVLVLRSAGDRSFCGGASFEELSAIRNEKEGLAFFSGFAHVINAMRKCPKFIVGRIQGKCVGGGVGLAAAVDYAIAHESAEIRLSELAMGIGPFVVGPAVERKIGVAAFSQLAIDASMWRNADWARRKGLYAELHTDIIGLDESLARLTDSLVHSSVTAMAEMKKTFWRGTEDWDRLLMDRAAISGRLILAPEAQNALARLKKK